MCDVRFVCKLKSRSWKERKRGRKIERENGKKESRKVEGGDRKGERGRRFPGEKERRFPIKKRSLSLLFSNSVTVDCEWRDMLNNFGDGSATQSHHQALTRSPNKDNEETYFTNLETKVIFQST